MRLFRIALSGCLASAAAFAATPTFNRDVLPILQQNCQECHRPGEIAPMSLLTYQDARPWAKAIKAAVVSQKMPPWFADPKVGHFANDRRLSAAQIQTLAAWADNGAPEGEAKDRPAPRKFPTGWNIKPDMVIEMPNAFQLPSTGTIDYQYMLVKGNITEDIWVKEAEMRPSNNAVLHHGKVWVRPPGSHWMENATPGVPYSTGMGRNSVFEGNDIIGKFNPGLGAQTFEIEGSAKLIPKGSDFVFELHYTATWVYPSRRCGRSSTVCASNAERMAGRKRYPLVLMLEPLFRCNLACAGCGKIQYPAHVLKMNMTPEQCFRAVEECGAPMVSIPGGEPLMHPQSTRSSKAWSRARSTSTSAPTPCCSKKSSPLQAQQIPELFRALDGEKEHHDFSVCKEGGYELAVEGVREAVKRGFRVTTNTTLFDGADPKRARLLRRNDGARRRRHDALARLFLRQSARPAAFPRPRPHAPMFRAILSNRKSDAGASTCRRCSSNS
jgi:hypothetical protein